jgi:hypothetical protein
MSDEWIRYTGSEVCGLCLKVLQATVSTGGLNLDIKGYNKHRHHKCIPPTLQKINGTKYITTSVGTFRVTECGAVYKSSMGTNCIYRCAVLSAAHVITGVVSNDAEAQRLDNGLVHYLRSAEGRRTFPPDVMNGMDYASIDSRLDHYCRAGYAGNVELVGLSSFTRCAIDVYEPAADGSVTVTSHVANGASEHERIRLWREHEHYQSITYCPPPSPRNATPPTTPDARPKATRTPAKSLKRAPSTTTVEASPGNPAAPTVKRSTKAEWLDSIIKQFINYGNEPSVLTRRNMALVIFKSSLTRIMATDAGTDSDSENSDEPTELPERLPPTADSLLSKNIRAANLELAINQVGRAKAKLLSSGILAVNDALLEKLRLKYPPKSTTAEDPPDPEPDPLYDPDPHQDVINIGPDCIIKLVNSKSKYTGAGHDGWSFSLLKNILHEARKRQAVYEGVGRGLMVLINDIANARLDTPQLRQAQTTLRGIPLRKGDTDDVRPIGIGQLFVTIAGTLAVRSKAVQQRIPEAVGPTELMHGIRGGFESLAHIVRAYLHLHPDHVAVKTDVSNAFNTLDRRWVLRAATCYPQLEPLAKLLYGQPTRVIYSGCTEKNSTNHEIIAETGWRGA